MASYYRQPYAIKTQRKVWHNIWHSDCICVFRPSDLSSSIVRFHQWEDSISRIWTNERGPLCLAVTHMVTTDSTATPPKTGDRRCRHSDHLALLTVELLHPALTQHRVVALVRQPGGTQHLSNNPHISKFSKTPTIFPFTFYFSPYNY